MSLILEALRKSEQQRRLGEVPTLGSESAWAARRWHGAPARAARWPWIAGACALLAIGGAAYWWLRPSGDAEAPLAASPTGPAAPDTRSVAAAAAGTSSTAADATTPSAAAPAGPTAAAPAPAPLAPPTVPAEPVVVGGPIDPAIQARLDAPTPAPDGEYPAGPAPADAAVAMTPAPDTRSTTPPAATAAVAPTAPPAAPPAAAAPMAPAAAATREPAPATASPPAATSAPAAAPTATSAAPVAPAPVEAPAPAPVATTATGDVPLVYALPLATRQALPALKISMHVWNAEPARRFVILGDTRAAEGESAGNELTVVEIRRDGVVLDFRGTRFLLPRGGY